MKTGKGSATNARTRSSKNQSIVCLVLRKRSSDAYICRSKQLYFRNKYVRIYLASSPLFVRFLVIIGDGLLLSPLFPNCLKGPNLHSINLMRPFNHFFSLSTRRKSPLTSIEARRIACPLRKRFLTGVIASSLSSHITSFFIPLFAVIQAD